MSTKAEVICPDGTGPCHGETPVCCQQDAGFQCVARDACDQRLGRFECDSPADCLAGQLCCEFIGVTVCTGFCPSAHGTVRCDSDADCPAEATPRLRCADARCVPPPP
jgi:hypothetical protein